MRATFRRDRRSDFTKLLIGMIALPIPLEFAIALTRDEPYDLRRGAVVLATIVVLFAFSTVLKMRAGRWHVQSLVGYLTILIGLAVGGGGLVVVYAGVQLSGQGGAASTITSLATALGLTLVAIGVYLIRDRRIRAAAEVDVPLPKDIYAVRISERELFVATWMSPESERRHQLITLAREALSIDGLHYVALFGADAQCQFYVDLFDEPRVSRLIQGMNSDRRETYVRMGAYMRRIANNHEQQFPAAHTGSLVRLVLDVEQGATYYYEVSRQNGFLVGVTLDQVRVDPADWTMAGLAESFRNAYGLRPSEDYYRLCPICGASNHGLGTHSLPNHDR